MAKKTKIVATLGPSSSSEEVLKKMALAGLNVARLNFSHGDHAFHEGLIKKVRRISEEINRPVSLLQDLQGPKIRVDKLSVDPLELVDGEIVSLSSSRLEQGKSVLVDLPDLEKCVRVGQKVLLDDGLMEMVVENINGAVVVCKVIHGGLLNLRKGVNFPGASLPFSCITDKDKKDLEFGLSHKVDYVALSFVRKASDIVELKKIIKDRGRHARVVAKIEMAEALEDLEAIVRESDAIMVARGDLAVEVGQAKLARIQKEIISLCNRLGKPVITATQMLESMVTNVRPTRAEITDVSNAVYDGSDALMLSAETATGDHPVDVIETMTSIILEAEKWEPLYDKFLGKKTNATTIPEAIAQSAAMTAKQLKADAIVCLSTTGRTSQLISRHKPKSKLIALTAADETVGRLELCWGVRTVKINPYKKTEEVIQALEQQLIEKELVQPGDTVVLTLGVPVELNEKTNALQVFKVQKR